MKTDRLRTVVLAAAALGVFVGILWIMVGGWFPASPLSSVVSTSTPVVATTTIASSTTASTTEMLIDPDDYSDTILTAIDTPGTGHGVTVTPISVEEDSRCPNSVQCVWPGRVVVRVQLTSAEGSITESIVLKSSIRFGTRTIKFEAVTPARAVASEIDSGSYKFVFTVSKG